MATISSHTLNSTDGTHAGDIPVRLTNLTTGSVLFDTQMDPGGRLQEQIEVSTDAQGHQYELCFNVQEYWSDRGFAHTRILNEVTLRFVMPDPEARYHMPVILSPNGYSCWISQPE